MRSIDIDSWREIFSSLGRHKLRTALTAFGVFWGIFMLVNLMGLGKGLENGMVSSFGGFANSVFFWTGRPSSLPYKGMSEGRQLLINESDLHSIQTSFNNIEYIAPLNGWGERLVVHNNKYESFRTQGIHPIEYKARQYRMLQGRFINELDLERKRKVAVIGDRVKESLFDEKEDPLGKYISVAGIPLLVVGVFVPTGTSEWQQQDRKDVLLPRSTLVKLANQGNRVHTFTVNPHSGVNAVELEADIVKLLKERHRFHPDDPGVVGSYNGQKDFNKWSALFAGIAAFSWFVSIGTIVAGAIGVSNIMLITVKERTKEIGIRKAIGATPKNIIFTIVQESLLLTFIAGYFGLVAGVVVVEFIATITMQAGPNSQFANPEVSFSTALLALIVLLTAGALASYIPARRAANINPVTALQEE